MLHYSYTLVYRTSTVPELHIFGFSKNVCQLAVRANLPGINPGGFKPNFNDRVFDVFCFLFADSAVL